MTSYKNIIEDFKLIAENHKQINSFGTGDIENLIYLTTQKDGNDNETNASPLYPLLYVIPGVVNRDTGSMTYNLSVLVMDIMSSDDVLLETQLLSDTLQMIDDVLAQFKYSVNPGTGLYQHKYDVNTTTSYTPFTERYDDFLVGWTLSIQVIVDVPIDRCGAPFNPFQV